MVRIMASRERIVPDKLHLTCDGTLAGRCRSSTHTAADVSISTIVQALTLFRHFVTAHSLRHRMVGSMTRGSDD
jgi:hypothetical protein